MVLWTIQHIGAWKVLERTGVLQGDVRYIENFWLPAYQWLAQQMRIRLGGSPSPQAWPVWAWYQWEGEKKPKPDLRSGGHLPKKEPGVLLELEVDPGRVLLSDFELWHYVLNYWYLPRSEEDGQAFEAMLEQHNLSFFQTKPLPVPKFHRAVVASWQRIFDIDWSAKDIAMPRKTKSIQATMWEIRLADVRSVRKFIAR